MTKYLYLLSIILILLVACRKQPKMDTTAIFPLDGEWRVKVYNLTTGTVSATTTMYTSNTAANNKDSLLLRNGSLGIVGKVYCNVSEKTFSITNGILLSGSSATFSPAIFTLSDGKVLLDAATPPSGAKADSIVFFIDQRGTNTTKYRVEGFRRTFWLDDESW